MAARIRGVCDAFEVTVDEPQRGDHELRVDAVFAADGPTDRATIGLYLYARRRRGVIRLKEEAFDTEAYVSGTAAVLERGETGRLRFTRPLPAFVVSHRSENLEVTPVLVTQGDDGSRLSLQLDVPAVAEDARLVVRGLPRSERLRPAGVLGRLRRRRFLVGVEQLRRGAIAVTAEGPRPLTGGHVRLEAVEYMEVRGEGGYYSEWEPPLVTSEASLLAAGAGSVRAELALPEATAAPASIQCAGGQSEQGVRWMVRLVLEDDEDDSTRVELPLHVGVEREGASS